VFILCNNKLIGSISTRPSVLKAQGVQRSYAKKAEPKSSKSETEKPQNQKSAPQQNQAQQQQQQQQQPPAQQSQQNQSQRSEQKGQQSANADINFLKAQSTFSERYYWKGPYPNIASNAALDTLANRQAQVYQQASQSSDPSVREYALATLQAAEEARADRREPIRVAVTGASGQIGYALLYRIASGGLFGPRTPVSLHLLELPQAQNALKGVVMELRDCAFPALRNVVITDSPEQAFEGVDWALLVGAQPRAKGMERGDLLMKNAEIFAVQGKALNNVGKGKDTRVVVVGNPANTNAMIASRNAPKIPPHNFAAMTRLDHNRGLSQLAEKADCSLSDIDRFIIWGNHSATQFPDIDHALIKGQPAASVINDAAWVEKTFIPNVQQRGAAIIAARGSSSAASAANALMDNVVDWHYSTYGKWTSTAVFSEGQYGVEKGLFFSYPIIYNGDKSWSVVEGLSMSAEAQKRIEATHKELLQERDGVVKYLPQ